MQQCSGAVQDPYYVPKYKLWCLCIVTFNSIGPQPSQDWGRVFVMSKKRDKSQKLALLKPYNINCTY